MTATGATENSKRRRRGLLALGIVLTSGAIIAYAAGATHALAYALLGIGSAATVGSRLLRFIAIFRFLAGVGSLLAAALLSQHRLPPGLVISALILGGVILAHLVLSFAWTSGGGGGDPPADQAGAFRGAAQLVITTDGIVLALISFADRNSLTVTTKVGASSLGVGVVVSVVLYALAGYSIPKGWQEPAASTLFNVAFWALSFGLICIVGSLW